MRQKYTQSDYRTEQLLDTINVMELGDPLELLHTDDVAAIDGHGVDQLVRSVHLSHRLKQGKAYK